MPRALLVVALLLGSPQAAAEPAPQVTNFPSESAKASALPAPGTNPDSAPPRTNVTPATQIPFEKYELANGLTVILHRDTSLPLVAVNIWYDVGPRNEPARRSGFAHLFEHLMFAGSRHVGRDFDVLLESVGATNVNGTTSYDRTNYFETVPREHLELALWIESDRMGFLLDVIDEKLLEVQRDVVKNERRQSFENAPYGPSYLALLEALFPAGHPYNGAVIGSMADLSAATLDDVRAFFLDYYAPSNATLTLAGDFEMERARALVAKYFGSLPDRPKKTSPVRALPSPKAGRITVEEPVELAEVTFGFRTPPAYSADDPLVDVAMAVLAGGKATRLYQSLIVRQKLASQVSATQDSNQLSSMAIVSATVASGKSVAELEKALESELRQLEERGPSELELTRAKRRILVGTLRSLELLNGGGGESGRAGLLQRLQHYTGDPGYLPKWIAQIEGVTAGDVQRVLREHLKPERRVTVVTQPKAPSSTSGAARKAAAP
jgi:zinc protease